jgi:hypothetical protein
MIWYRFRYETTNTAIGHKFVPIISYSRYSHGYLIMIHCDLNGTNEASLTRCKINVKGGLNTRAMEEAEALHELTLSKPQEPAKTSRAERLRLQP